MKDLINRFAFGFIMAQLFPGALAVFAVGFAYFTLESYEPGGLIATADHVLSKWGKTDVPQTLFLIGLCIGFGMFIHGLQWATLGSLEHRSATGSIYVTRWYSQPLWKQILKGPARIVWEVGELLVLTRGIENTRMYESITEIGKDSMAQFDFLEEFYLATGQFFLHTAYALMLLIGSIATYMIAYGITWRRMAILGAVYLLTGLFFTLGRIQMNSLFEAEKMLRNRNA